MISFDTNSTRNSTKASIAGEEAALSELDFVVNTFQLAVGKARFNEEDDPGQWDLTVLAY